MRPSFLTRIGAVASVGALAALGAVVAPSTAQAKRAPQVVQLGDSYSAGNGTMNYTETNCYRSPSNYGAQVAASLGATYTNVACSGGVVADITNPRALGSATLRTKTYRIDPASPDPKAQWLAQAKANSLCGTPSQSDFYYTYTPTAFALAGDLATDTVSCQLYARPQIDAVTPDTTHVFLTMGGNDIGFSSIVISCLALRDPASCQQKLAAADAAAPAMGENLTAALTLVQQKSKGHAKISLLGYPFLINTSSYTIPEGALPGTGYNVGAALEALQRKGDAIQAGVVAALGGAPAATFVDVKPTWGQHAHSLDPRIVANNSQSWLWPVLSTLALPEWVHPKQAGWNANAGALADSLSLARP